MKQKIIFFFLLFLITFSQILTGCIETEKETNNGTTNFEFSKKYEVKVVKIIDGDTIDISFENGTKGRVRFLGVDTPETNQSYNYKNEYRNITDQKCLTNWGLKAKNYTTKYLQDKSIYIEFDKNAGIKGGYNRWLCYISFYNGTDFNEMLLKNGYARVFNSEIFSRKDKYLNLENYAVASSLGLWSCSD